MIEVVAKDLTVCPDCGEALTLLEYAIDFCIPNKKYLCPQHGLIVAFPNEQIFQAHRALMERC